MGRRHLGGSGEEDLSERGGEPWRRGPWWDGEEGQDYGMGGASV